MKEMVLLRINKLRRWELALLVGTALAALWCGALGAEQDALAEKVVRLHVVANSDSQADQALKLKVRDAVLAEATPYLTGLNRREAVEALEDRLPAIARAAAEVVEREGYSYPVTASLREETFPTKRYDDFALPGGGYTALRLEIGTGAGRNWWCVVFPPLCMSSVEEVAAGSWGESGLTAEDVALITGESEGYVVKFKAMELWESFKAWLG